MHASRTRSKVKTEHQQQRAVSGQMLTDIEMNGASRGAVEDSNLSINVHPQDVLVAEGIRTFPTLTVDVDPWFHQLKVETTATPSGDVDMAAPPVRKPNCRGTGSTKPWCDAEKLRFPICGWFETIDVDGILMYMDVG